VLYTLKAIILMPYVISMEWLHRFHDALHYYKSKQFRATEWALFKAYWFKNPYRMCKKYFKSKALNDEQRQTVQTIYGETLCMTFDMIQARMRVNAEDRIYELGAGRFRGAFFLHAFTPAHIVGIEMNPTFVKIARDIQTKCGLDRLSIRQENMLDSDLSDATLIYFYGVAFNDEASVLLINKFAQLPAHVRILCVGFSLNEYEPADQPKFTTLETFPVFFLWGRVDIWVMSPLAPVDTIAEAEVHPLENSQNSVESDAL